MIPERLEFTAFGPFVTTQVIDFARLGSHGLFLIHGPTGSGKSTLLDALTYALFGASSGGGRGGDELVASQAGSHSASAALTFEHAHKRYRVRRTPRQSRAKKRGGGTVTVNPTAELYELTADGEKLVAEGVNTVTKKIEELLRCDADQFRQTVVLPQGQFRSVIEDDKTRHGTLSQLFATDRFRALQERLGAYAKHLGRAVGGAERELAELREQHGVADLAELEAKLDAARAVVERATAAHAQAEAEYAARVAARAAGELLADSFAQLASVTAELAALTAKDKDAQRWRLLLAADSRAREAEAAVEAWRRAREAALQRAAAASEAATALEAAALAAQHATAAVTEHERGREARDSAAALAARLTALEADLNRYAAAREAAARAAEAAEAAARRAEETSARRDEAARRLDQAREKAAELQARAAELGDTGARIDRAAAELRAAENVHAALAEIGELERTGAATIDLERLWEPLSFALRSQLGAGEPCPVCGSTDHRGSDHAAEVDAAELARGVEEALRAAQEGQLALAGRLAAARERLRGGLEAGGWEAADTGTARAAQLLTLAQERALAARAADDEAKRLSAEMLAADQERELAEAAHKAGEAEASQAAPEAAAAAARATEKADARDQLAERLEPRYRDDPGLFTAELAEAREVVSAYDQRLAELEALAADARTTEAVATARRSHCGAESVAAQEAEREATVAAHAALLEHGFVDAAGEPDEAAQLVALLDRARRAELKSAIEQHQSALDKAAAREQQLRESLAGKEPPDLQALEAAVTAAATTRDAAGGELAEAKSQHASVSAAADRWRALESALGEARERHRTAEHLADLASGKLTGHFRLDLETYVLRRILTDVLLLANRHLAGMTAGRFQLRLADSEAELRANALRLEVEDRQAGGARRRVTTLSGGEGFMASLALALGLSEMAQRTSGAVEVGALFVDEGFGSLDSVALEEVVTVLRRLPGDERRMVGVITHVEALRGRIAAQLVVTATPEGSSVAHHFG